MSNPNVTLLDGSTIEFLPDQIGEGGEKIVFFTPDKSSVVAFFKDPNDARDPERFQRLESVLGRFNPTIDPKIGAYWKALFCWPTGIVIKPSLGVVAPAYPKNFFFTDGKGEKSGKWFSSPKLRKMLPEFERGNLLNYLKLSILMARAVKRLHNAGLAHSDLSCKNVLVDPSQGTCIIIDIDSLVVPGVHPPKVLGTPGYIAPEVVAGKALPSIRTDLHALPVLIYEYFFLRHPLKGPQIHSTKSAEEDDMLVLGEKALFIEDETNRANRYAFKCQKCGTRFSDDQCTSMKGKCNCKGKLEPYLLLIPYTSMGPYIAEMFKRAFVDGLHSPEERPTAMEWERALVRTTDLILPCQGSSCEAKWFVFSGSTRPICPFCGWSFSGSIPILNFYCERRPGQFTSENYRLVVWHNQCIYKWHIFDNVWPGEDADRTTQGYFAYHHKKWLLVNQGSDSMKVINSGQIIPSGQMVELTNGAQILLSSAPHGRLAVVQMLEV